MTLIYCGEGLQSFIFGFYVVNNFERPEINTSLSWMNCIYGLIIVLLIRSTMNLTKRFENDYGDNINSLLLNVLFGGHLAIDS